MALKIAKAFDALVGGLMIGVMFFTFGAYSRFTVPSLFAGIVFLLVQRRLSRAEGKVSSVISAVLRVLAVLWLALLIWTVFAVGADDPKLYAVKKSLYIAGNYPNSNVLDFMPEKIPECTDYEAHFVPPMAGQDAHGWVNITFTANSAGFDYLRSQAESHGAEHYTDIPALLESESDADRHAASCAYLTGDPLSEVTEMYVFGETRSRHKSCYLLNAETGRVIINW